MKFPKFDQLGSKLVGRFFRQVDDCVWDLTSGRIGVRTADDEIATLSGEGDAAEVQLNPFAEFGMPLPAFAQSVPVAEIKQGDLIYNNRKILGWVIGTPNLDGPGKKTRTFKLLKPDGTRGEWSPAKLSTMGLDVSGAMVLRSLMNMLGGNGLAGLQGNLMPLLMLGGLGDGEGNELEQMLPLMLLSQMGMMGGATAGVNPMGNMLPMMLMMKMFKGDKPTATGAPGRTGGSFFDSGR